MTHKLNNKEDDAFHVSSSGYISMSKEKKKLDYLETLIIEKLCQLTNIFITWVTMMYCQILLTIYDPKI